jgi:hypothetical protein
MASKPYGRSDNPSHATAKMVYLQYATKRGPHSYTVEQPHAMDVAVTDVDALDQLAGRMGAEERKEQEERSKTKEGKRAVIGDAHQRCPFCSPRMGHNISVKLRVHDQ